MKLLNVDLESLVAVYELKAVLDSFDAEYVLNVVLGNLVVSDRFVLPV